MFFIIVVNYKICRKVDRIKDSSVLLRSLESLLGGGFCIDGCYVVFLGKISKDR